MAAGAAGAASAASSSSAAPKNFPSKELTKPLSAAQDDLAQKKYDEALTQLQQADAFAKKTPYDQHLINHFYAYAYLGTKDMDQALKHFEAQVDDGFSEGEDKQRLLVLIAKVAYQAKNFDKAIDYGSRAITSGAADPELGTLVGQAYYLKGDWKGTQKFEHDLVEGEINKGATPESLQLQLWHDACYKANDQSCQVEALKKLVAYYPKPEYWEELLSVLASNPAQNDRSELQLYRLMLEVNVLKRANEYSDMARLARSQGSPGEAQQVLEKGFANNVFTDAAQKESNQKALDSAKKVAAGDVASLPALEKEAATASTGSKSVAAGYAYLGYQQYDKAADLLSKGLAKGGLSPQDEAGARLLLGIAQLRGGKKDDAVQTFQAVKGDPLLEQIAGLWAVHAKRPAAATSS